jgi:hypothetical protein
MEREIKLNDLIETMTPDEKSDFLLFLQSKYANPLSSQQSEERLWRYLSNITTSSFDRDEAFVTVFPDQPFVKNKLEKVLSKLHQLLKKFIAYQAFEQRSFDHDMALLRYYRERRLLKRHAALSQQIYLNLTQNTLSSQEQMRQRFELDYEICIFTHQFAFNEVYEIIPTVLESLEAQYLSTKLMFINNYLFNQKNIQIKLPEALQELIQRSYYAPSILAQNPALQLLHALYLNMSAGTPDFERYEQFSTLFKEHEARIDPDSRSFFALYLRNHLATLALTQAKYKVNLFNLQKEHYEKGYLYFEGKLTPTSILSFIILALQLSEVNWCEQFVHENQHNILGDPDDQPCYKLCLANVRFYQQRYEEALSLITPTLPILEYQLLGRRLEIKCYYELQSELTDYKVDAFRIYLGRASKNTITDSLRERNINFVYIVQQLVRHNHNNSSQKTKLLARIESKQLITDREWLIQKVQEG